MDQTWAERGHRHGRPGLTVGGVVELHRDDARPDQAGRLGEHPVDDPHLLSINRLVQQSLFGDEEIALASLEKLGEAHAEHGDPAKAVTIWVRAAEVASVEEDEQAFATLRERIRGLDAAAAERLGGEEPGSGPVEEAPAAPAESD